MSTKGENAVLLPRPVIYLSTESLDNIKAVGKENIAKSLTMALGFLQDSESFEAMHPADRVNIAMNLIYAAQIVREYKE